MEPAQNFIKLPPCPPPGIRNYWWVTALFVAIGLLFFKFDFLLASPGAIKSLRGDVRRIVDLSELFAHGFGVFLIAVGMWNLAPTKRRYLPRVLTCALLPSLAVHLIKMFVARARPTAFVEHGRITHFPDSISQTWLGWMPKSELNLDYLGQSFPSAHAATVCGLAMGLSWVFPRGKFLFFTIAALASLQRVTSLAHWSSDVIFGMAIAVMMAGALTHNWGLGYWLGRWENRSVAAACENEIQNTQRVA